MNTIVVDAVVTYADELARLTLGQLTGIEGAELQFRSSVADHTDGDPDHIAHFANVATTVAAFKVDVRTRREVRRG